MNKNPDNNPSGGSNGDIHISYTFNSGQKPTEDTSLTQFTLKTANGVIGGLGHLTTHKKDENQSKEADDKINEAQQNKPLELVGTLRVGPREYLLYSDNKVHLKVKTTNVQPRNQQPTTTLERGSNTNFIKIEETHESRFGTYEFSTIQNGELTEPLVVINTHQLEDLKK